MMGLNISAKNWWETDTYTNPEGVPPEITLDMLGPKGEALVKVFPDGTTKKGWGESQFMANYLGGDFLARRALHGYDSKGNPFAFVMRSMRLMCVDIDGKNGGLEYAGRLGALPLTLAETSKSGNGYHLFYETDEEWDDALGFNLIPDQIGITQGVDIRGTGCVYHHNTQRWNGRPVAKIPAWLKEKLLEKQARRAASAAAMKKISTLDEMEQLMAHSELLDELAKPIPAGKRNITLFALGTKLMQAGVPNWEEAVEKRGDQIGLGGEELSKIIANINKQPVA